MTNIITEKTIITEEKIILQLTEKQYNEEIEDSHFANTVHNIKEFVLKETGKVGLSIVDVRYKDNNMDTGIIEIETKRSSKKIDGVKI